MQEDELKNENYKKIEDKYAAVPLANNKDRSVTS